MIMNAVINFLRRSASDSVRVVVKKIAFCAPFPAILPPHKMNQSGAALIHNEQVITMKSCEAYKNLGQRSRNTSGR